MIFICGLLLSLDRRCLADMEENLTEVISNGIKALILQVQYQEKQAVAVRCVRSFGSQCEESNRTP